jgi:hypothetical protein
MEMNCWPLLSKKTIVADDSGCVTHCSKRRMLDEKACNAGSEAAEWKPIARRFGAVI